MKIFISGYGKMGRMVEQVLLRRGICSAGHSDDIAAVEPALAAQCVCIDFTTPAAFRANYSFIASHFKAAVIGTTGWDDIRDRVIAEFNRCGTTMIYASNFSIGVNILFATVDFMSRHLAAAGGYAPYIVEKHHCHKLDAPSGTAKTLAETVERNMDTSVDVQSVRCGEIPGIHTVGFEGVDDRLTITHEAFSRMGFATGAVAAALKTATVAGVHQFKDIIFE